MSQPKRYKLGSIAWIIPGYRGNSLIAIRCTITKIEKIHHNSDDSYWVDEPMGHPLSTDYLHATQPSAAEDLKERIKYEKEIEGAAFVGGTTLNNWRKEADDCLKEIWDFNHKEPYKSFKFTKKSKKEWFTKAR